jgi:hypothetical protein
VSPEETAPVVEAATVVEVTKLSGVPAKPLARLPVVLMVPGPFNRIVPDTPGKQRDHSCGFKSSDLSVTNEIPRRITCGSE